MKYERASIVLFLALALAAHLAFITGHEHAALLLAVLNAPLLCYIFVFALDGITESEAGIAKVQAMEFRPRPDITAYELALALKTVVAVYSRHSKPILELPPECWRHFAPLVTPESEKVTEKLQPETDHLQ